MTPSLTKEFIFACKLKNVPIPLHVCRRRGSLKLLLAHGILEESPVKLLGATIGYNVLYPIQTDEHTVIGVNGWVNGDKAW